MRNGKIDLSKAENCINAAKQVMAEKLLEEKPDYNILKFDWNEKFTNVFNQMALYFSNHPDCKWNLNKGVFLAGPTGNGKTTLAKVFKVFSNRLELKEYEIVSSKRIALEAKENSTTLFQYFERTPGKEYALLIDDVGHEIETKSYGMPIDSIEEILTQRYNSKLLTHATSNMSLDKLLERYGTRFHTRVCEMFNFIELTAPDQRLGNLEIFKY